MEEIKLVCVACPIGCDITVTRDENKNIVKVEGNTCPRGKAYAVNEVTAPTRMVTSTVKVNGGRTNMVPVKTAEPIPKGMMFDLMNELKKITLEAPVTIGQVVIENVLDTGVNIVATNNA